MTVVVRRLTGLALACCAFASCSDGSKSEQPAPSHLDATERPGAIVIHPILDPNLTYDTDTKRVVDHQTGDFFASAQIDPINRIFRGAIRDKSGKLISDYEYRYGGSRLPDGELKAVYEIIWALRGEDEIGKTMREQLAGRERAKSDSLEKLASFLRAQRIGHYGGTEKGEIVLVDRRMDDLRREMR